MIATPTTPEEAYIAVLQANQAAKHAHYDVAANHDAFYKLCDAAYAAAVTAIAAWRKETGRAAQAWIEDEFDGDTMSYAVFVDGKIAHRHWHLSAAYAEVAELRAEMINV